MKLLDDFYDIINSESIDNEYRYKVRFNPSHYIYQAHFPGNPITPGVCLVQIVTEILQSTQKKKIQLSSLNNIKFKKIVRPDNILLFVFTNIQYENSVLMARVSIEDEQNQFVKMSLVYNVID